MAKIEVLDHGYVEHIESWGHGKGGVVPGDRYEAGVAYERGDDYEAGIIEAARQSTQGSFRGWDKEKCDCDGFDADLDIHPPSCASVKRPGDAKLLKHLYENKHETPFEFAGMVIEVQAPIFIFREWHRHRTQSYNEMSARYTPLPDLYYLPTEENVTDRTLLQGVNKQAGSVSIPDEAILDRIPLWMQRLTNFYRIAEAHYQNALADGIPKELARLVMPVGHYSRMRASANLRNWLAFLTLRTDPKAQWEIRQFAAAAAKIVAEQFPNTYSLWAANQ